MNNPKAEKALRSISVYSKKVGVATKKTSKWVSRVSQTVFHLSKHFCGLKSQELRMKKECMKLGELAYNRWKRKKAMSLQEHLNMIKELDLNIQAKRQKIFHTKKKLVTLLKFKTSYSSVPTKQGAPQKTVDPKKEVQTQKTDQPEKKTDKPAPKKNATRKKPVKKSTSETTKKKSPAKPKDENKETK